MWQHQQEALSWCRGRKSAILHLEPGCGKTRIALEAIREAVSAGARRILVGCPKAVIPAWLKQVGLWSDGLRVVLLDRGTAKDKGRLITAALADTSPVMIVGNYESLRLIRETEKVRWCVLVWDELHRLKSPSGATSKWAARVAKNNPDCLRYGLTGTLLAQGPLDAFGAYRAVESPACETFGTTWTLFRNEYAITNPAIPGMVIGYRNQARFAEKIAATTFHRRSADVLDLPEIHHVEYPVELTPREAAVYRQLDKDFCAMIDEKTITPANAMVSLLRMLQACSGAMRLDESDSWQYIDQSPSKRAALVEFLEDAPVEPLVIFGRFRADIDSAIAACRQTGRTVSELSGKTNQLAAWQAGESDVLVAQIQSGGIGIDLTRASVGIFLSCGHSLSEWLQAIARLHRPGQTRCTKFFSFVSTLQGKDTADGRVYSALKSRQEVIDAVLDAYSTRESQHAFGGARAGR